MCLLVLLSWFIVNIWFLIYSIFVSMPMRHIKGTWSNGAIVADFQARWLMEGEVRKTQDLKLTSSYWPGSVQRTALGLCALHLLQ